MYDENNSDFIRISKALLFYDISRPFVSKLVKEGSIKIYKLAGATYLKRSEINALIEAGATTEI